MDEDITSTRPAEPTDSAPPKSTKTTSPPSPSPKPTPSAAEEQPSTEPKEGEKHSTLDDLWQGIRRWLPKKK
jgi:hypothetical protein